MFYIILWGSLNVAAKQQHNIYLFCIEYDTLMLLLFVLLMLIMLLVF